MTKQLEKLHKEIIQKQKLLDSAREILKEEFIGIDRIIDELIDAVNSWFLFPDLQDKPVIINLWGLTGVGKSSLVNRLAQLLKYDSKYYHFDLGDTSDGDWTIKRKLEDIYVNVNGYPVMIALDEFQHARTIDEMGKESEKKSSRIIWQLLDSGKFPISRYNFNLEEIYDLSLKLRYLLKNGVRVSKGKVISQKEYFIKEMELKSVPEKFHKHKESFDLGNVHFVPAEFYDTIYSLAKEKFAGPFDVKKELLKLNDYETIDFLIKIFEFANSPKIVDCSKSVIFVLGNLDEAYTMSNNFNPDMNADEFHEQSLKINIPIIKKALRERLRNEQIARLGNIHIIYPAFSSYSFRKLIKLELDKVVKKVKTQQKVNIEFDESICDLIFREGIYPTQGARPIFTTIHQLVNTKLGKVIIEMILKNISPEKIIFKAEKDIITIEYYENNKVIHSFFERQILNLEKLRKNRKDDVQAITAVHESGHAIISAILLKIIPEVIFSTTAEVENQGFVYTKFKWKYISRKEILSRLSMYLAGFVAEKIVFGEENVTTGAESDIKEATQFIAVMLKECGMGELPASYQVKHHETNNYLHDENNSINNEVREWIKSAKELAEKTLKEQETLLLKMADYLSDNRMMLKEKIKELIQIYSPNFDESNIIEKGDDLFYRKHLKQKISELTSIPNVQLIDSVEFSLNKNV
jgi:cell division protease FtsH